MHQCDMCIREDCGPEQVEICAATNLLLNKSGSRHDGTPKRSKSGGKSQSKFEEENLVQLSECDAQTRVQWSGRKVPVSSIFV